MSVETDAEARQAIALAVAALDGLGKPAGAYRLISIENLLQGPGASPACWRIGFKLRELIPDDDTEIGKGGDFYVKVDVRAGVVTPAKGGH